MFKIKKDKWFDFFNTTTSVFLGFVLGLFSSFVLLNLEHHRKEEATARILAFSVQDELSRTSPTQDKISNVILKDKSFLLYPTGFNSLHNVELLNSLKPSIGELAPEVVAVFVKYEFYTRQCALWRDNLAQQLQKEMNAGNTNRGESDSFLNAYAWSLRKLDEEGTNLQKEIYLKYPNAIKPELYQANNQ